MKILSINYSNFRNYKELFLEFKKPLIFFIGNNGEGKTNIIEGIYLFSTLKSFRDNLDEEMINWNSDYYYIRSEILKDVPKIIEIGYSKEKKKKIKLNGNELNRKADLIGELKTVALTPTDLKIIEGGPVERRKFIDTFLCSINKNYMESLLEYTKILKQRNKALKEKNVSYNELFAWDKMLSERGSFIKEEREKAVLKLTNYFQENLTDLSMQKDSFEIKYRPNIKENNYLQKLNEKRDFDLKMGFTSVGIHRDELFIGKENLDLTSFGSQGQKRSTVIAMKISTYNYIREVSGVYPILLIDDVIRELDAKRREFFVSLLKNSGQVFFTTTDLEGIKEFISSIKENIQVFKVEGSLVKEIYL